MQFANDDGTYDDENMVTYLVQANEEENLLELYDEENLEPVSYTHLDVYKRQALRGTGKVLVPMLLTCGGVCSLRILWLFTAGQDVYKRQNRYRWKISISENRL